MTAAKHPAISMIVARSRNHVIGRDNQMPWKISADLQFFKTLPGRRNIVVSRNADLKLTGAEVVNSLDAALATLNEFPRVFVIGGEQLFTQAFPKADRLYITEINIDVDGGDTFFEVPNQSEWKEVERTPASEGEITFNFITLERK
ncbi:MAG: hypothetical protein RJA46_688 [Pseudomonadota bacterium]